MSTLRWSRCYCYRSQISHDKNAHWAITNILETSEKVEKHCKEIEDKKKMQVEILIQRSTKPKWKVLWLGSITKWRGKRKQSVNWKTKQLKLPNWIKETQNNLKLEKSLKQKASGICGIITKGLKFLASEFLKETKRTGLKIYSRNNEWNFLKFGKRCKHTDSWKFPFIL